HQIPGAEAHNITRYHFAAWQFTPGTITEHTGRGSNIRTQFLDGVLRAGGLDEVEDVAEQDNDDDDGGINRVTQNRRDDTGHKQNGDQRIQEQAQKLDDGR